MPTIRSKTAVKALWWAVFLGYVAFSVGIFYAFRAIYGSRLDFSSFSAYMSSSVQLWNDALWKVILLAMGAINGLRLGYLFTLIEVDRSRGFVINGIVLLRTLALGTVFTAAILGFFWTESVVWRSQAQVSDWLVQIGTTRLDDNALAVVTWSTILLVAVIFGATLLAVFRWRLGRYSDRTPFKERYLETTSRIARYLTDLFWYFVTILIAFLPILFAASWGWAILAGVFFPFIVSVARVNYADIVDRFDRARW